jgi:cytochrome c oxidase subunit 4
VVPSRSYRALFSDNKAVTSSIHTNHARIAAVWIALLLMTAPTTGVAYIDLGRFSVVVALTIAVCKMLLVALFFMHVRHSTKLTKLVVLGGLLWLGILLSLTMADFATRGWVGM